MKSEVLTCSALHPHTGGFLLLSCPSLCSYPLLFSTLLCAPCSVGGAFLHLSDCFAFAFSSFGFSQWEAQKEIRGEQGRESGVFLAWLLPALVLPFSKTTAHVPPWLLTLAGSSNSIFSTCVFCPGGNGSISLGLASECISIPSCSLKLLTPL